MRILFNLFSTFILFCTPLLFSISDVKAEETHYVSPGDVVTLRAPPGKVLRVSNGKLLKIKDNNSSISVFVQKEGEGLIYIGEKTHRFYSLAKNDLSFFKEVAEGLLSRKGLSHSIEGQELILTGTLHRFSDWLWLSQLAQKHQASYQFRAQIDQDVRAEAQLYIQNFLSSQTLEPLQFHWGPPVLLTLPTTLKSQSKSYENALSTFGLKLSFRDQQLELRPSVQVEVVMAELMERVDREFGMSWSPFGEFQVLPQSSLKTSLNATLKALENRGLGKVLATPRLLTRSGSEAEFHSGGEFPISITEYQSHYKSQNIVWKKHGIVLKFKPRADRQGRISLKIYAELSVLGDRAADGVPSLLTNKIESEFDLTESRTVALSGLIRQDWHRGRSGLPWVSQVPVLGTLFSSENYLNRRSELVIFVTPKIINEQKDSPDSGNINKNINRDGVQMPQNWNHDSL